MNVLIVTDSLELGRRALTEAVKEGMRDRIVLAYALFPAGGDRTRDVLNVASVESGDEAISERLFAEARRLGERHGVTIQTSLVPGDNPDEIPKAAIDHDAGRVVIAMHGDGAGVAERVRAATPAEVSVIAS